MLLISIIQENKIAFLSALHSYLSLHLVLGSSIDRGLLKRSFTLSDIATTQDSKSQLGSRVIHTHKAVHTHTRSAPRLPPLLDEVIIARRVHASIALSAQELSIHTYCVLCASVKASIGIETRKPNQSPMHIKKEI